MVINLEQSRSSVFSVMHILQGCVRGLWHSPHHLSWCCSPGQQRHPSCFQEAHPHPQQGWAGGDQGWVPAAVWFTSFEECDREHWWVPRPHHTTRSFRSWLFQQDAVPLHPVPSNLQPQGSFSGCACGLPCLCTRCQGPQVKPLLRATAVPTSRGTAA